MWAKALLLSLAMAASAASTSAHAQPVVATAGWIEAQYQDRGDRGRGGGDVRSLRDVVEELRARYGGELVNAQRDGDVYVIRWRMPNGEIRDFRVSAAR